MPDQPPGSSGLSPQDGLAEWGSRMRRALAGTPVTVFGQDADLRYSWICPPRPSVDSNAIIGLTDGELLEPASAEALIAVKRAVLATGEPRRQMVRALPIARNGLGVYDVYVEPVTDRDGVVTGLVCTAVDVSEFHAEAEAAKRAEARFRAAVEAMMDPFGAYTAVRDAAGRIVDFRIEHVNEAACAANMMTREAQVGHLLCEIFPAHRENGLFEAYCRLVETGEPLVRRDEVVEGVWDGQHLVRAFDIVAARHEDGFVATWRDVTERRRQELALAAALRESDLLRQELEHRVTNNLQILSTLIGMAAREAEPRVAEALSGARRKVELLGSLQATLRNASQHAGMIALDAFVSRICEAMRAGLGLGPRGIALEVSAVPAMLGANEAIMLGLFVNELVTNASKHAFKGRDGGRITVALTQEEEFIVLTVADDGIGIGAAEASGGGSGSKLVERLAAVLGGKLSRATSATGTTFRLALRAPAPAA